MESADATGEDRPRIDDLPWAELAAEAPALRDRIRRFREALGRHFVGKQPVIDLMTVCAVAQEPLLLVGPPGTAKSDLVVKFRDALQIPPAGWFEYMLTRFTEPSEVLGPIDIKLLREGRYVRRVEGKLPTARMVFLDEIFQSNSAILNALLTVINERKYYQDGVPRPVALKVLFAATNDVPEHGELAALRDRFCLKVLCEPVQREHFVALIDAGLDMELCRDLNQRPWVEGHATLDDLLKAHRYLALSMRRRHARGDGTEERDRDRFVGAERMRELRRLIRTLSDEDGVFISDRKVIKLYRLLRTHAWIERGGTVEREDLLMAAHLGETRDELLRLRDKVPRLLDIAPRI